MAEGTRPHPLLTTASPMGLGKDTEDVHSLGYEAELGIEEAPTSNPFLLHLSW